MVPFVAVHAVDSLDEALELSNGVVYGLTAGIYSEDQAQVDQFRDCEGHVSFAAEVEDLDGIRVGEFRGQGDLALEPLQALLAESVAAQHLHRGGPLEQGVPGPVDHPHATLSELLLEDVARQLDHLHAIAQGAGDVLQVVGRRDELHLREIEGDAQIVVGE